MEVRLRGLEQDVVERERQRDVGETVSGGHGRRTLDFMDVHSTDDRNIPQYAFVAHVRLRI
jgi:hypothetical protein